MATVTTVLAMAAFLAVASLAWLVSRADRGRSVNRRLAAVFCLESTFLLLVAVSSAVWDTAVPRWTDTVYFGTFVFVAVAYCWFLATLATPLTAWLRPAAVRVGLIVMACLLIIAVGANTYISTDDSLTSALLGVSGSVFIALVAVFGLIASVSALRRAPPGSTTRERAGWFVAAFGLRDVLYVVLIIGGIGIDAVFGTDRATTWWTIFPAFVVLAYAPIMTYGLVRHQILDIDLKLKIGIRRSTVVTLFLIVVLAAAKVSELYLNRTFGFVAGGIAAGIMLVLAPRLNKFGEKVAQKALPHVDNSSSYVQFRKMEVYRAALESAHETGGVTEKERLALERLRAKMGISTVDAKALETEVQEKFVPASQLGTTTIAA